MKRLKIVSSFNRKTHDSTPPFLGSLYANALTLLLTSMTEILMSGNPLPCFCKRIWKPWSSCSYKKKNYSVENGIIHNISDWFNVSSRQKQLNIWERRKMFSKSVLNVSFLMFVPKDCTELYRMAEWSVLSGEWQLSEMTISILKILLL